MSALKSYFSQHRSHMAACGVAAVLIIAGIVFAVPALAIGGVAICGSMMIAMVWMMVSMSGRHG
jgi:hypothetical protein